MTIKIDYKLCTNCGKCIDSCMMDVIGRIKDKISFIYPEDCQNCFLCVKDCPEQAIKIVTSNSASESPTS